MADREIITEEALALLKEEAKGYIRAFCQTPIGRVISIGAREVIQAKKDGRELDETDLAELCLRIPAILKGADLGPGGKK